MIALRRAFNETMRDPLLVADLSKAGLAYAPMSGEDIASFVDEVYRTPAAVAERAAELLDRKHP